MSSALKIEELVSPTLTPLLNILIAIKNSVGASQVALLSVHTSAHYIIQLDKNNRLLKLEIPELIASNSNIISAAKKVEYLLESNACAQDSILNILGTEAKAYSLDPIFSDDGNYSQYALLNVFTEQKSNCIDFRAPLKNFSDLLYKTIDESFNISNKPDSSPLDYSLIHAAVTRKLDALTYSHDNAYLSRSLMDLVKITSSSFGAISVLKNDTLTNENVLSTISFDIKDKNTSETIITKTKDIPEESRIFSPLTDGDVFISNSALTLSEDDKRILGDKAPDIDCLLSMPLVVRGEVIGVVTLFNSHKSFSKRTFEQLKPLIGVISASAQYDRFTQLCDTYENAISHSKTVDSLTGLPNYNSALNHIEDLVRAKDKEFTLCTIDIIQFNTINESYSRAAGDVAILQLANILKESLGDNDFVSRLLGDTFILVIEGHLSRDLLESISSIISTPFMIGQDAISLDANMGAVYGPIADISGIKLLRLSYTALEKSRNSGEIAIANPDFYIQKNDASTTLQDISVAFEKGQITLLESPVINCETNEIDFISLTPYWNHPTEGRLSSDRFMALIETNFKSISNFDFNVVMQAIEKLKSCPMKSENKPIVVISVSHSFLISDYIPKVVAEICSSEGLNPARICFSINDDSSSITEKMICEKVSKLRSIGVKLALSNFDTNTCSLSRLYKLPVDIIQVNKSNRNDSKESSNAIKATVAIGKVYNKMIIVKGIESKSDYDLACDSGALHLQGTYLKSKTLNQA